MGAATGLRGKPGKKVAGLVTKPSVDALFQS